MKPSKGQLVLSYTREGRKRERSKEGEKERKREKREENISIAKSNSSSSLSGRQTTRFHLRENRERGVKSSLFYIAPRSFTFFSDWLEKTGSSGGLHQALLGSYGKWLWDRRSSRYPYQIFICACYVSRNIYTRSPITQHLNI